MTLNWGMGNLKYGEKKTQKNPKYQNVKTTLDTGASLSQYMERLEERRMYFKFRKDEIFKRLKVTTLAQMIIQAASVLDVNEMARDSDSRGAKDSNLHCHFSHQDVRDPREAEQMRNTARSKQFGVFSCERDVSLESEVPELELEDRPYPNCPYMLLDVRDRDDYNRCHIIGAYSFPLPMLFQQEGIKEMWAYKNKPGKMIILYDEDESLASQAATVMCQRGFDNVFMLSGGLKIISKKFPESMTTGSMPTSSSSSSTSLSMSSLTSSKRRKKLPPQQQQQQVTQTAERRRRFTSHELSKIQQQLEEISSQSSRVCRAGSQQCVQSSRHLKLSTMRSQSGLPRMESQQTSMVQSRRPWK